VVKINHIALHTKYNYQAISVVDSKLLADQEMSVISTYLKDNAQTPLNHFTVYMLYKQVCNKHGDKSNRWSLGLSYSVRGLSAVGTISKVRRARIC